LPISLSLWGPLVWQFSPQIKKTGDLGKTLG
jgi:hypothetical protein